MTGIHERKRATTIIQSVVAWPGLAWRLLPEGVKPRRKHRSCAWWRHRAAGLFFSQAVPANEVTELRGAFEGRNQAIIAKYGALTDRACARKRLS